MLIPIFELFYEKKNITQDVSKYATSIEYTDIERNESDELQITFEDSEYLWQNTWIPTKGDSLRAYIGYEAEKLLNRGTFKLMNLNMIFYRLLGKPKQSIETASVSMTYQEFLTELSKQQVNKWMRNLYKLITN